MARLVRSWFLWHRQQTRVRKQVLINVKLSGNHTLADLGSVHTELLAMALALAMPQKWVEYPFLTMIAVARSLV